MADTKRAFTMKGTLGSLDCVALDIRENVQEEKNAQSVAQNLAIPVAEGVNDGNNIRSLSETLLLLHWYK